MNMYKFETALDRFQNDDSIANFILPVLQAENHYSV